MSKFKAGMEAFITSSPYASNVNKAVRLITWVGPNETLGNDDVAFNGGEIGGWVVRPILTKTMLSTSGTDIPMICNVAFIQEQSLSEAPLFESLESELTEDQIADKTVFLLDDDAFDSFTMKLKENPMSKNKSLQELLARPSTLR